MFITLADETDKFHLNCNTRRVEAMKVNLDGTSRYYRPLGITYTQSFDASLSVNMRLE